MESRRIGLARTQALLQNLKRSLDLNGATLTDIIINTAQDVTVSGTTTLSGTSTLTGNAVGVDLAPSLCGLTATTQNTSGTTTGANNTLMIKNYTGAAEEIHTLPAATVGARTAILLSKPVAGGINDLIFDCAGTDKLTTASIVESRSGNVVVFDTSTSGETRLKYTPDDSANNFAEQGSIFYFWCTEAGFWNVQLFAKADPQGTGLKGACAFAA